MLFLRLAKKLKTIQALSLILFVGLTGGSLAVNQLKSTADLPEYVNYLKKTWAWDTKEVKDTKEYRNLIEPLSDADDAFALLTHTLYTENEGHSSGTGTNYLRIDRFLSLFANFGIFCGAAEKDTTEKLPNFHHESAFYYLFDPLLNINNSNIIPTDFSWTSTTQHGMLTIQDPNFKFHYEIEVDWQQHATADDSTLKIRKFDNQPNSKTFIQEQIQYDDKLSKSEHTQYNPSTKLKFINTPVQMNSPWFDITISSSKNNLTTMPNQYYVRQSSSYDLLNMHAFYTKQIQTNQDFIVNNPQTWTASLLAVDNFALVTTKQTGIDPTKLLYLSVYESSWSNLVPANITPTAADSLSTGTIIAIATVSITGLVIVSLVGFWLYKRYKNKHLKTK